MPRWAGVVGEPPSLPDVVTEGEASGAPGTRRAGAQCVTRIIPVIVDDAKELERTGGGELDALSLVEPEEVAGEAQIDLDPASVYVLQNPVLHPGVTVGTIHGLFRGGVDRRQVRSREATDIRVSARPVDGSSHGERRGRVEPEGVTSTGHAVDDPVSRPSPDIRRKTATRLSPARRFLPHAVSEAAPPIHGVVDRATSAQLPIALAPPLGRSQRTLSVSGTETDRSSSSRTRRSEMGPSSCSSTNV